MARSPSAVVVDEYPIPFELRKDQKETIDTLCSVGSSKFSDKAALFMDVGTGKTVVATLIALYKGLQGSVDRVLIVMPPILLNQWPDWIAEFPTLTSAVYYGPPAKRAKIDLDVDVLFTSFGMFKNDFDKIKAFYADKQVMLIVDEATALRNIQTLFYAAVREFSYAVPGRKLLMLTGTALGRPEHAYAYISLKTPEAYKRYTSFRMHHVLRVDDYNQPVAYKNLDTLQENLLLNAVWLKAEDVLDLPEVTTAPIRYQLEPKHRKLYDKLIEDRMLELDDGEILDGTTPNRMYHTCQRAILAPSCYGGDNIVPAGYQIIGSMLEDLGILAGSDEKVVVYCNYNQTNEEVKQYIQDKFKLPVLQAYGVTGPHKNLKTVERFLKEPDQQVLVAHPKSIGIGLNLQSVCRALLFLELPITANDYIQALGRVKREGQKRPIIVWIAVAKSTIQVRICRNVTNKESEVQKMMPTKENLKEALYGR